jgi:site-specific DNA recombinase
MRENFTAGSVPFRKAYLRSLIDVIEVDDHQVRIKGTKEVLEKAVLASQNRASWCSQTSTTWRSLGDSNPCFRRERDANSSTDVHRCVDNIAQTLYFLHI